MFLLLVLFTLLDADKFRTREAADAALTRLAPFIWPVLLEITGTTEEVRLRCQRIVTRSWKRIPLAARQAFAAKLLPMGWDRLPWISGEYRFLEEAHAAGWPNPCPPAWADYREACRLLVLDMAGNCPPQVIQGELERLAGLERVWIEYNWASWRNAGGDRRRWR